MLVECKDYISQSGTTPWTLHALKIRCIPKTESRQGELRKVSDEKPWEEKRMREKQAGEKGTGGF